MSAYILSRGILSVFIILICFISFSSAIIMIGLAILFGCKVTQKVHMNNNRNKEYKNSYKPHKTILGTFDSTKALIDYALVHDVYPDQIAIVNMNGFAAAFNINKKANNYIELVEVIVDWDEVGYQRVMENLIEAKEG